MGLKIRSIQDFINFKYDSEGTITKQFRDWQRSDENRFEDVRIWVVESETDILHSVFIQDVEFEDDSEKYIMRAILGDDLGRVFLAETKCVSPCAKLDWSKVLCAFKVKII